MSVLGYLAWWTVREPLITDMELREHVQALLPEVKPPSAILPHDAFRRLTGSGVPDHYTDSDDGVRRTLSLQEVSSPKATMSRAILLTRSKDGVRQSVDKVGDVVFYKPPRNEWSKARIRFTPLPGLGEAEKTLFRLYTDGLRREYERALHHVNGQAVRRIVRAYLAAIDAASLDGTYLLAEEGQAQRLCDLLDRVGNAACRYVAVWDTPVNRRQLERRSDG